MGRDGKRRRGPAGTESTDNKNLPPPARLLDVFTAGELAIYALGAVAFGLMMLVLYSPHFLRHQLTSRAELGIGSVVRLGPILHRTHREVVIRATDGATATIYCPRRVVLTAGERTTITANAARTSFGLALCDQEYSRPFQRSAAYVAVVLIAGLWAAGLLLAAAAVRKLRGHRRMPHDARKP